VSVHPSNDYLVTAAGDGTWCFYDVAAGACVAQVADEGAPAGAGGYSCAALHPGGLILATGTAEGAAVRIWETRTQKNVAKFDGHEGRIAAISFSENGWVLAVLRWQGALRWQRRPETHTCMCTCQAPCHYCMASCAPGGAKLLY
jgi:pre-mRNA-processing factor 19